MVGQPHLRQHFFRVKGVGRDGLDERHVFVYGQRRDQVVELKNKPNRCGAVVRQLVAAQRGDVPSVHPMLPLWGCPAREQVQQRAFPAPLGPSITANLPSSKVKLTPSSTLSVWSPLVYTRVTF